MTFEIVSIKFVTNRIKLESILTFELFKNNRPTEVRRYIDCIHKMPFYYKLFKIIVILRIILL